MYRIGTKVRIARLVITWGLMSASLIWVTTPSMFYILRFLLGALAVLRTSPRLVNR